MPTSAELFLGPDLDAAPETSESSSSRPPPPPVPNREEAERPPAPPVPPADDDDYEDDYDDDDLEDDQAPEGAKKDAPNARQKKQIYTPYMSLEEAEKQCAAKKLVRGTLRVSGAKPSYAWVRPDGVKHRDAGKDILVRGRLARNRAVHGDIVYVEVVENAVQDEVESDGEVGSAASDSDSDEEVLMSGAVVAAEDGDGARANGKRGRNEERQQPPLAKVVAIAERKGSGRVVVCTLHANLKRKKEKRDKDADPQVVLDDDKVLLAKPTDKRMPWILIPFNKVTRGVLKLPGRLNEYMLWPVLMLKWKDTSQLPLGRLKGECLGEAGDMVAEVKHALIENQLDDHDVDFDDELMDEADEIVKKSRAEFDDQCKMREDLRGKRIFTIDPATAKDLDDAIHVEFDKAKNQVEIGVHIADVGHFVRLGSRIDQEAQRRTTSVYLIDRVLPMLPHALCNHLCSLNPNEPKLSFSAFFRLDCKTGELIRDPPPRFSKSVICCCCRFNYDEVQLLLDGKDLEEKPNVYNGHKWRDIEDDIFRLYDVCGKVRRGRMEGGALSLTKTKMIFHTRESVDGIPSDYHLESHSASHWIIEELMLLANRCVAEHLAKSELQNDGAVLRNHQAPDQKKASKLTSLMRENLKLNFWDGSSAGSLHRSCQEVARRYGPTVAQCVEMMCMRAGMQQAEYFVFGPEENPHHFALNFDYYTHFTSPIRRYPDVMVHRVLQALVDENYGYQQVDEAMDQVIVCNEKKTNSRRCQEQLDRAVFCVYLRARKEWFYTLGTILSFHEDKRGNGADAVTIYCAQLGKEKKVQLCTEADLKKMSLYDDGVEDTLFLPRTWKFRGRGYLELEWAKAAVGLGEKPAAPPGLEEVPDEEDAEPNGDGPQLRLRQKLRVLACVPVVVIPTHTVPIDYGLFFVSPFHKKYQSVNVSGEASEGFEWTEVEEEGVEVVHEADE
eukprot:TRINITY_DN22649_c0_g4_i1.p1 TRINITY_DN22649_c0_g4~~TRINITY_DN22649_c0_g4_i1.p1  ORF type:complete len:952 (-),score=175.23 TRINITY_DN22649_c0_g4_i1:40-2895(-)